MENLKTTLKELIEATGYEFTDELLEMMPVAGDMEVEAPEEAAQAALRERDAEAAWQWLGERGLADPARRVLGPP